MPTVQTKAQLIEKMIECRAGLEKVVSKVTPDAMDQPGVVGEWSAKDVLAHVAHWQELHMGWWAAAQAGETPEVPAPGITWKELDKLNQQIFLAHRDQASEDVLWYLRETFRRFMAVIEATAEEDLFKAGLVSFTGNATLARWYMDYARHDGFGKNKIYQALVRKPRNTA
jgi:hypothetical protein